MANVNFLELLKQTDLSELKEQLQLLEGELELATQKLRGDIDALKLAIKMVDMAQNGKPTVTRQPRKAKAGKAADPESSIANRLANGPSLGDRAITYLEVAGEASPRAIAKALDYDNASYLNAVLSKDSRFVSTGKGTYRLRG